MLGKNIILSADHKGRFIEGIISGTPKPGVIMELYTGAQVGGRNYWRVYTSGTNGKRQLPAILLPDNLQGFSYDRAYVSGERCFLYVPALGEEFNMLCLDVGTGTGENLTVTQVYTIATGSGKLIIGTGSETWRPFIQVEATADVVITTGTWVHVMYTG